MSMHPQESNEERKERDWSVAIFFVFLIAYLLLQGVILPAAGVPT